MYYRMDKLLPIMLRKLPLSYTVQWHRPRTQHNGQSWASSITGRTWEHHVNHVENFMWTLWEHYGNIMWTCWKIHVNIVRTLREHHVNMLKNSCEHCENIMGTSWEHKSHNRCYRCISLPNLRNILLECKCHYEDQCWTGVNFWTY